MGTNYTRDVTAQAAGARRGGTRPRWGDGAGLVLALLLLLARALPTVAAPLPATGVWVSATQPIGLHPVDPAILLPNGKVLTGGLRYDIAADTWEPQYTPPQINPYTAVRLADGRVLALGAVGEVAAFNGSREALYDAAADRWTFVASMLTRRDRGTATLLADGSVLVVGGADAAGAVAAAERYDPAADRWTAAGTTAPRVGHTATRLADGRVLVVDGAYGGTGRGATAEIYDPATNSWTAAAAPRVARGGHTATLLVDGTVLVAGGADPAGADAATVERYDPAADAWATVAPLPAARVGHTATRLADGSVLLTGGLVGGVTTAAVERYDPGADRWMSTPGMRDRSGGRNNAVALADGSVLVLNDETTERFYPARPAPSFADLPPGAPGYEAVTQLAARDIARGYGDGRFGPGDTLLRAQATGLVSRGVGLDIGGYDERFPDRGATDAELWRRVNILASARVARGYEDGTFDPTGPVLKIQVISLIARAHQSRGYWQVRTAKPTVYGNVPVEREDLLLYLAYAGTPPDAPPGNEPWVDWDQPASRAWAARALWQALNAPGGGAR